MGSLLKKNLKLFFRRKTLLFWTLLFPMILSTLFFVAIKPAYEGQVIKEPIKVAVVGEVGKEEETKLFTEILTSIEVSEDHALASVEELTYEEALQKLNDKEIESIYRVGDEVSIETKLENTNTFVLETVATSYNQQQVLFMKVMQTQGYEEAMKFMQESFNVTFEKVTLENNDVMSLQFYTVFGMSCFYCAYWGLQTSQDSEGNQSPVGARKMLAPTTKVKVMIVDYLSSFIVSFLSQTIVFFYMIFVLGMQVGSYGAWMLLLIALGCLAGISWGKVIATAFKISENAKMALISFLPLVGSFLAGMMSIEIKRMLDTSVPIVNRLNPMNWIVEGLYSLYVYGVNNQYMINIASLAIFTVLAFIISVVIGRRKQYESL